MSEAHQQVIDRLSKLLTRATAGEFTGLAVVVVDQDTGSWERWFAGTVVDATMIGALQMAQHRLCEALLEEAPMLSTSAPPAFSVVRETDE